jgi:hypothetical protein
MVREKDERMRSWSLGLFFNGDKKHVYVTVSDEELEAFRKEYDRHVICGEIVIVKHSKGRVRADLATYVDWEILDED